MSEKIIIEGGVPLNGTVKISGAKNAALKMIAASILTSEKTLLKNVPHILDVDTMISAAESIGVKTKWLKDNVLEIDAKNIHSQRLPLEIISKARASFVFMGPLLSRFKKIEIANPGGCRIGLRPVNRHIEAVEKLGAKVEYLDGYYHIDGSSLKEGEICFAKNTHTGTENVILASIMTPGKTVINNAAAEPEIDDLIAMLNKMGAQIKRLEERKIEITGVTDLHGVEYSIMGDRNEAVTFAIAAVVTGGKLFLEGIDSKNLLAFLNKASQAGVEYQVTEKGIHVWKNHNKKLQALNLETAIHPGFMTDWQPPFVLLLSQAEGESTIHETVMDNRFGYLEELSNMGLKYELFNPEDFDKNKYNFDLDEKDQNFHTVRISGPQKLQASFLDMPDLRAGATLVLAALMAEGVSEITGLHHVDRGYEKLEERLQKVGARIKRVKE